MIVGAAVVPTAPLLVPDVAPSLDGVAAVRSAVTQLRRRVPPAAVMVLLSSGPAGVLQAGTAALTAVGLAGTRADVQVDREALDALSAASGLPVRLAEPLPLGLSVLALLLGPTVPVVAVSVPAEAGFTALSSVGAALGEALAAGPPAVVVSAGDLAAGLSARAPLAVVPGADAWDARAVNAVAGGRLEELAGLGPQEAARVSARAWAPLAVLHGLLDGLALQPTVLHYSAPRGVGYLVADAR